MQTHIYMYVHAVCIEIQSFVILWYPQALIHEINLQATSILSKSILSIDTCHIPAPVLTNTNSQNFVCAEPYCHEPSNSLDCYCIHQSKV